MAKTYCSCVGNRGMATRCGGNDGVRVSAQSYDGSVIVYNWYDNGKLKLRVGTNDRSSCYSDNIDFVGSYEEFNALLKLNEDIKNGKVSIVRHRVRKEANRI